MAAEWGKRIVNGSELTFQGERAAQAGNYLADNAYLLRGNTHPVIPDYEQRFLRRYFGGSGYRYVCTCFHFRCNALYFLLPPATNG